MIALLIWLLSLTATESPGVEELSEALLRPQIAGPPIADDRTEYVFGRLVLDLSNGSRYPISIDGQPIGFFFTGKGGFRYRSTDPLSAESFDLNVRRATGFELKDGLLSGSIESVLLLESQPFTDPPSTNPMPGEATEPPPQVVRRYERHLERFADDRLLILPNILAQALLEPRGIGRLVAIQMTTSKDDLLYLHDEIRSNEATLFSMQRFPDNSALRGSRNPEQLISRPLSGTWLRRDGPRFTLREIDFELKNPEGTEMSLEVREKFELHEPVQTLALSLWSEVFKLRKPFEYELTNVTLGDGTPLHFSHRKGDLVVQLERPVARGDLELVFSLRGEVLQRPSGNSYWWLPIDSWLPLPRRLDARGFKVHGVVKVAEHFIPFAMGRTVRRWREEGLDCLEFQLDDPVQFPVVLAGRYHSYSETRGEQTITLSSYAFAQDQPMRVIAGNLFELIDYYAGILGDFPYPELNILEINSFGFGIAPPGVIYLTREGFDPGPNGKSFRREINRRLAHEVGHMWWGHVAQMSSLEDQWLSESIAEYLAAVALEEIVGRDSLQEALREWRSEVANSKSVSSIYMANRLAGERADFDRGNLLYSRGPLMLHDLREEIGDEAFLAVLRRFANETRFEHVDTLGFIELTDQVTGQENREWFDRELFGLD